MPPKRRETYEEIAALHWRRTRPQQWAKMRPSEQKEFVADLAQQVREGLAASLDAVTPTPRPGETPQEAQARTETARWTLENDLIREILLPAPPTGPTDPDDVEALEEEYRLGRPMP